jgi:hypothetical protein
LFQVRVAIALGKEQMAILHDRDARARDVVLRQLPTQQLVEKDFQFGGVGQPSGWYSLVRRCL